MVNRHSYRWCFRRGYSESLGNDANKVSAARSVPQQFVVVELLERLEAILFSFSADFEYVHDLQLVGGVRGTMSVGNVFCKHFEFFTILRQWLHKNQSILCIRSYRLLPECPHGIQTDTRAQYFQGQTKEVAELYVAVLSS